MNLKIKFIPYERFKRNKFRTFLKDLQESTILLIDAKLTADEEAHIIKETMRKVSGMFTGIELNSLEISNAKKMGNFGKIKNMMIERIIGKKRGLTIIGPAKTIRQIKKNPEELLLYM